MEPEVIVIDSASSDGEDLPVCRSPLAKRPRPRGHDPRYELVLTSVILLFLFFCGGSQVCYRWNPNSPYPVCYPCNSPSTHLGALISTHLGAPLISTHLGALIRTHLGALISAHLGALISNHLGALISTHLGALIRTNLGALISTHLGTPISTHQGVPISTHLAVKYSPDSYSACSNN